MPWEPIYPYQFYLETPIRRHSIWHDLDHLARRICVLEQKIEELEKIHEYKEPNKESKEE